MRNNYETRDGGSAGLATLGFCITILVSLMAFWVADSGLFDEVPLARLTEGKRPDKAPGSPADVTEHIVQRADCLACETQFSR